MILALRVSVLLFTLLCSKSEISLFNTDDGLGIDQYDCVLLESLGYCRRPRESIDLLRNDHNQSCQKNGAQLHRFSELRSSNITVSTLLHQWKLTREGVEQYSLFLKDPREQDGSLCQCLHPGSFGKNCEYQLPVGKTFEEALQWQLNMRKANPQEVQIYGDIVCHETLRCDSGLLCLDWREICDGIQQCMSGWDEENCDLLEMNRCDENEYRCANGMCIPQEFFLDGDFDCLDWSDEMPFKGSEKCPMESVNTGCDDRFCPPNFWSCGDGQCIRDRLAFQKGASDSTCVSKRDQSFMCETHSIIRQWTMRNGRCFGNSQYEESQTANLTEEQQCEYLLKCLLSRGQEKNYPCRSSSECVEQLDGVCPSSLIQYPRGAVGTPFTSFLFNRQRHWTNNRPDFILINGTVRCRGALITVNSKIIPFDINWSERQMIEQLFCQSFLSTNMSSTGHACHHENESTDVCGEWNPCLSVTRIRDGEKNCLNGRDEEEQREMELDKSCGSVRRHRFRCSNDEATCLSVMTLGDQIQSCRNGFDELWFGMSRTLSSLNCNNRRQDECSLVREYISQSSLTSLNPSEEFRLPFRSHCDTFLDLPRGEDEDLRECQQRWICPEDQQRCQTGQCISPRWIDDGKWDCADASDEYQLLNSITQLTSQHASQYNFSNRSYFVPSTCNQSHPFLCLSAKATQQGFSCFDLRQIGDGHVDCAGAIDERNTLEHCSESSSMLGSHFRCASTNTCIPFHLHCSDGYRCPRRSDDQFWCERQHQPSICSGRNDFVCFDGQCVKGGRCNFLFECAFGEDEYMCDYPSSFHQSLLPYRQVKRFSRRTSPSNADVDQGASNTSSSSLSPYWCNRGLGVLLRNGSVVCFCPPQYYGEKCEYHQDRLSVVLHLNLSESIDTNESDPQLLLVLFLFDDRVLMTEQFRLHSSERKKLISHFTYPHSSEFLQQRRQRFFNRSSLLTRHPFSIRIELYRTRINERPAMIGVWKYPVEFDHLPVSRLAKVLHVDRSSQRNPCSSRPCHPNAQCHQLMNNRLKYTCLCRTNFTGQNCSQEDQQCRQGYCATGSLCQPNSRSALRGNSLPFCLCPLDRSGQRCAIEHSACRSSPCLNGGLCLPDVQPDRVVCLCPEEYFGFRCQWKRSSIHLFLSTNLSSEGVVIQFFDIDHLSLDLRLVDQHVFRTLPHQIESSRPDQSIISGIVLVKLYSSNRSSLPDLHLVSARENVFSLNRTAEISSINRCPHLQTFSNGNSRNPLLSPSLLSPF